MATAKTSENKARQLLLVRAIEMEDGEALVLTRDDRQFATGAALAQQPTSESASPAETSAFLVRRADLALTRLQARYPNLRRALTLSRWPSWLDWVVPLGALLLGLATNVLQGQQLNIVAFPLLGMVAWNLLVYLWLAIAALRRSLGGKRAGPHPLLARVQAFAGGESGGLAGQPTLERGVARFTRDWAAAAGPVTHARGSRTLHVSAALFAVGVLAGMLVRARYMADYTAGWSGTWAGAEHEIAGLLGLVLGPASVITGIDLPTAERLRDLRGGAENAGNWLILWAVTAALFVIIPRTALAIWSAVRSAYLGRHVAVPGAEDFYVRSLLRNATGRAGEARVVPYGFTPGRSSRERMERLLVKALGERTRVLFSEPVAYGGEDAWLAGHDARLRDADQLVLLFALASTPEAENHGAFARGVVEAVGSGAGLTILLDDSSYRHRLRGQASAERRLADRVGAWKQVIGVTGHEPVVVSLELGEEEIGARLLERALQRRPVVA